MFGFMTGSSKDGAVCKEKKNTAQARIICVDDHKIILSQMLAYVRELVPEASVTGAENAEAAFALMQQDGCDILFTEIELEGKPSGIALARQAQEINPQVNIIFTTVCSQKEYAEEVMNIRPSGYLTKVVTKRDVQRSLQRLLYAVK